MSDKQELQQLDHDSLPGRYLMLDSKGDVRIVEIIRRIKSSQPNIVFYRGRFFTLGSKFDPPVHEWSIIQSLDDANPNELCMVTLRIPRLARARLRKIASDKNQSMNTLVRNKVFELFHENMPDDDPRPEHH